MKKIKSIATDLGIGISAVFGFFMIPSIAELFTPKFLMLLRQVLALGFGVCLFISPNELVKLGASIGPKLSEVYKIFFRSNKRDEL